MLIGGLAVVNADGRAPHVPARSTWASAKLCTDDGIADHTTSLRSVQRSTKAVRGLSLCTEFNVLTIVVSDWDVTNLKIYQLSSYIEQSSRKDFHAAYLTIHFTGALD